VTQTAPPPGEDLARDLEPLFSPRSVAILGASNDEAKWGHWIARGALLGAARRKVHLVNQRGGEVLGRPVVRSLAEIGEPAVEVNPLLVTPRGAVALDAQVVLEDPLLTGKDDDGLRLHP
jgi:predicted CoA-binding protein